MADQEPANKSKRKLRAPAQTVRQQADKAVIDAEKPKGTRTRKVRAATGKATSKPRAIIRKTFDRQPFRFIGKVGKFVGRIIVPRFVRNAFAELKLVKWPSRKETRQLTFAVLMFAIIFGATIAIVDYGLDKLFREILLK